MGTKTSQRKPGTSTGTLMRSRQAKTSHISLKVKLRCAPRRDGWGRLSDNGPGQYNPDRSEGPWGRAADPLARRCSQAHPSLTQSRELTMAAEGTKDDGKPARWEGPV